MPDERYDRNNIEDNPNRYENNMQANITNIPPNDIEAEQAILSCMLEDKEAIIIATERLKKEDFYRHAHASIFECMNELFKKNVSVDIITLKAKLDEYGITEQVGGMDYLKTLAGMFFMSSNIENYVQIIEERSILRKLIRASSDISTMSYTNKEEVQVILEQAEKKIFDISKNRTSKEFTPIRDVMVTVIEKMEDAMNSDSKVLGLSTGFVDLDYKTSGLHPSDLILLAARPSMGKTALALNIALNAAKKEKVATMIFSLEMSKDQLVSRLVSAEGRIDSQNMRTGSMTSNDLENFVEATGTISDIPIFIDDTPGITPMEVRAKCRRLKLEHNLGLIVIDYLQLMSGNGKNDSRQQEISEISRSLKAVAREMEAPVIALSQLSRACETRPNHRPILSDLRESGAIEQDADIVAFLYRDEYYNPESEKKGLAELIIAKQRNGPTGTVELAWLGQFTAFGNAERDSSFD